MSKSDGKSCLLVENDGNGALSIKIEGERHDTMVNLAAMVYSVSQCVGIPEQALLSGLPALLEGLKSKVRDHTFIDAGKIAEAIGEKP